MSIDVSVILPTRDRPAALGEALGSLTGQTLDAARFEVLVVDDGGSVDLEPVLEAAPGLAVRLIRGAGRGPGAARNLGAGHAVGSLLAFLDDDCVADPRWLGALLDAHRADPAALLGGAITNGRAGSATARASQAILEESYAYYAAHPQRGRFFASMNMATPARAFAEVGGFDESFRWSEDRELCDRWRFAGRRLAYVPGAIVRHDYRRSLPGFLRQHFGYGRGAYRYHRRRAPREGRFRPALGFYLGFLPRLARTRPPSHALTLAPLLVAWQAANAAGFVFEALRMRSAGPGAA